MDGPRAVPQGVPGTGPWGVTAWRWRPGAPRCRPRDLAQSAPSFLTQGLPAVAPLITAGGGLGPEGIGNLAALPSGLEVLAEWRGPAHLAGQEARVVAL
jgi:hypothetical protein